MFLNDYDVIVVGAGHAGSEAAYAAAKMGSKTLLITMNLQVIAQMSCNPAMGGIAKGQIVREIDAMGGMSGIITDKTMIQFRMLNKSKGPAMWSPRAQSDRMLFSQEWRNALEANPNVDFFQDMVTAVLVEGNKVVGVKTGMGMEIHSKAVILTNGTFLNGLIHVGEKQFGGGRMGEKAAKGITEQLMELGFESGRMKTGTPPRVDGRTIDFSKMEEQKGDEIPQSFSFLETQKMNKQRSCWITYTNPKVHDLLREGFDRSPMFNGAIKSTGPRYCPSIEDKINRFAERERHQIFAEPEGWHTIEYYINGFSTSLPEDIQAIALRAVPGFENVKFFRPGYAIEYDYFPPNQIKHTLETKILENLYFAGQINGTTGYEEAACQGLMAGMNAHLKINEKEPLVLKRNEAYIGVLIDDLITKGTDEPYRMFTSRAEYRIILRQDNADERLTALSHTAGLASDERMRRMENKYKKAKDFVSFLKTSSIKPEEINPVITERGGSPLEQATKMNFVLKRPKLMLSDFLAIDRVREWAEEKELNDEEMEQVEIQIKYEGYIEKEKDNADKLKRLENLKIPDHFDYSKIKSISTEARQKLEKIKPKTIAHASRISGISPADVSVLLVYMGR